MSDKVTASAVLRALRKYSADGDDLIPLWLVRHEGEMWVTAAHFAFRPNPRASIAIEELWQVCNLEVEEMRFTASLAITRVSEETPDLGPLVPGKLGDLSEVEPRAVAGGSLAWSLSDEDEQEMWRRTDGSWTFVNRDYALILRGFGDAATWHQGDDPLGVLVGLDQYGQAAALLMPIRPGGEKKLVRDPDLPPALFEL